MVTIAAFFMARRIGRRPIDARGAAISKTRSRKTKKWTQKLAAQYIWAPPPPPPPAASTTGYTFTFWPALKHANSSVSLCMMPGSSDSACLVRLEWMQWTSLCDATETIPTGKWYCIYQGTRYGSLYICGNFKKFGQKNEKNQFSWLRNDAYTLVGLIFWGNNLGWEKREAFCEALWDALDWDFLFLEAWSK